MTLAGRRAGVPWLGKKLLFSCYTKNPFIMSITIGWLERFIFTIIPNA